MLRIQHLVKRHKVEVCEDGYLNDAQYLTGEVESIDRSDCRLILQGPINRLLSVDRPE